MTALADKLAAARREAEAALALARDVKDNPMDGFGPVDVLSLAHAAAVLATAVLTLADYVEVPF